MTAAGDSRQLKVSWSCGKSGHNCTPHHMAPHHIMQRPTPIPVEEQSPTRQRRRRRRGKVSLVRVVGRSLTERECHPSCNFGATAGRLLAAVQASPTRATNESYQSFAIQAKTTPIVSIRLSTSNKSSTACTQKKTPVRCRRSTTGDQVEKSMKSKESTHMHLTVERLDSRQILKSCKLSKRGGIYHVP